MARPNKDVTIYKIAQEAGVSVPTVSRVINRRAGIAESTRNRITELLRLYNYRSEYPAMRTIKIAVVYPWADLTDYFRKAMKGIYAYSQQNDLVVNIIIADSYRKESLLEAVRDQQCSGVIALISEGYHRGLEPFGQSDLPVIVIDSATNDPKIGLIDNDSYSGSCAAAQHLLDLGHRKIGYLRYAGQAVNQLQRYKGAENTLKAKGVSLSVNPDVELPSSQGFSARGEYGYRAMQALLMQASELTAVMAVDDAMALGAMSALHEAGLRIPEDVSVIGFDNYAETRFWCPALTTVDHPIEKAGFMAIEAIHAGILDPSKWVPPREILPTSLVIRKSTSMFNGKR